MKRVIFRLSVMELFGGASAFTLEGSMKSFSVARKGPCISSDFAFSVLSTNRTEAAW